MPRQPRLKVVGNEAWYHLYNFTAAHVGEFPLNKSGARKRFGELLRHYSDVYFCGILSHTCMGNHFHIEARFDAYRKLERGALLKKALLLKPKDEKKIRSWSEEEWERFNQRLFDVSAFMKDLQQAFAVWYNRKFNRKGRFWGDRFKNTILDDLEAVRECMMYVDLNAERAGIVARPEDYPYSSLYRRIKGDAKDLLPISAAWGNGRESSIEAYLEMLYIRGSIPTRPGQKPIPPELVESIRRPYTVDLTKPSRFFIDGLIVGSERRLREWLEDLRAKGVFSRRKNPIQQGANGLFTAREQRSNHVSLN